ncbi:hypothetical protein [Streptomyces sp. NPDC005077]|uniref:hypothetical protein n=1 Tax=Streptomyces sp. NPDC005077 TaxID=3154292 RepID=UPI0033A56E04
MPKTNGSRWYSTGCSATSRSMGMRSNGEPNQLERVLLAPLLVLRRRPEQLVPRRGGGENDGRCHQVLSDARGVVNFGPVASVVVPTIAAAPRESKRRSTMANAAHTATDLRRLTGGPFDAAGVEDALGDGVSEWSAGGVVRIAASARELTVTCLDCGHTSPGPGPGNGRPGP